MASNSEGIKVSQIGYDATQAADQNLLFSSGWPNLKIEATGVFENLNTSISTTIYEHNLGYPPFFLIFVFDTNKTYMQGPRQNTDQARYFVDENQLAIQGAGDGTLPNINIRWYICRLPLNQSFQAPTYNLSGEVQSQTDNNFGLKVQKPGTNNGSTDLRDYTLHSGTRSPQIHSVTTGSLNPIGPEDYNLTWVNDLGYNPLYFAFQGNDSQIVNGEQIAPGEWFGPVGLINYSVSDIAGDSNPQNLVAFDTSPGFASIVVFKDPFAPPLSQSVVF